LKTVDELSEKISAQQFSLQQRRWLALQFLEGDIYSRQRANVSAQLLAETRSNLRNALQEEPELLIADARYQSIASIC
ncbi:ferrous iron transport protein B, partial [Bacillus subtilis]